MNPLVASILADFVLVTHFAFVLFLVLGQLLILLGAARAWVWVRDPLFRWTHLAGIAIVVGQAWAGVLCPLTTLEMSLRRAAGEAAYAGSFIQHWLHALIFFDAPPSLFLTVYVGFGLVVVGTLVWIPPRKRRPSAAAGPRPPDGAGR